MTVNDPSDPATGGSAHEHQGVALKNRGIRFSDSEGEGVRDAAQDLGITPAEFEREGILEFVCNPEPATSISVPANLVPLIERTFRYTYMLATRCSTLERGKTLTTSSTRRGSFRRRC